MKTKLCNQIATMFPDISSDTITKLPETEGRHLLSLYRKD